MRTIIICLLILAILFFGHGYYGRTVADRKLAEAIGLLPNDPIASFRIIKEPLGYNRMVAMGKVGEIEQTYLRTLESRIVDALKAQPADANAYPQAEQALTVLEELRTKTGQDTTRQRQAIIQAARDSVPVLKAQGSLKAWDNMMAMFQNLSGNSGALAGSFENFDKWFDEAKAVPRRPIGLRDAARGASESVRRVLARFQLDEAAIAGKMVAPAPADLTDKQLIEAEKTLGQALDAIAFFQNQFGEQEVPVELAGIRAKVLFNLGAIKLAHFQDRRGSIRQAGSDYLVEFLVRTDTDVVPTANEMANQWQAAAVGHYEEAGRFFGMANTLDEPSRRAYLALTVWSQGMLQNVFSGTGPGPDVQARVMQMSAGVTGKASEVLQAIQSTPRALLIVDLP